MKASGLWNTGTVAAFLSAVLMQFGCADRNQVRKHLVALNISEQILRRDAGRHARVSARIQQHEVLLSTRSGLHYPSRHGDGRDDTSGKNRSSALTAKVVHSSVHPQDQLGQNYASQGDGGGADINVSLLNINSSLHDDSVDAILTAAAAEAASRTTSSSKRTQTTMGGGAAMKIAALCFALAVVWKALQSIDWNSRKLDVRRCKQIAHLFMLIGWDEFDGFGVRVTIHCLQDIENEGMLGKETYQVEIKFKWSKFMSSPTQDLRWEQTKGMEVPQGANECEIILWSVGKVYNSVVSSFTYDTKFHMLDKPDFWGKKNKIKLEIDGKHKGTVTITFRKKGDSDEDELPISGIDEDSALAMELVKAYQDLCDTPGFEKPAPGKKMEGEDKMNLIKMVLEGTVREIDGSGSDKGLTYIKVTNCNFAELQGDNMAKEMVKQKKKAIEKGLSEPEKKWYWVWYESKKKAEHEKHWHYPDGFFPLISISSVHRSPERDDQMVMKYHGGQTDFLIYRIEAGKGLDTWVDGIELICNVARETIKSKQAAAKKMELALEQMRKLHIDYVKQHGVPEVAEQWTAWEEFFTKKNYAEEYQKALRDELRSKQGIVKT
eukprot:TRINITY_DN9613_c0_g1_i2.p1 TRINITY_DN9613_c0_g1~~TRINITY_DN9613_c0_g1_i2.p1  ORF type:complete len:606 (-),score=105.75 TRINITY_DN9613_c0_g1_i2:80-1897(-)